VRNFRQNATMFSCVALLSCANLFAQQTAVRAVVLPQRARKPAPAFRLENSLHQTTSLSNLHGHVALLNFWATECGGCRIELPYFIELNQKYRPKGLQTLGISMEVVYEDLRSAAEGWARVNPFLRDHRIEYSVLMADQAMSKAFNIESMPATFLMDKQGRIAAKYIGIVDKTDLETNITALLAESER